MSQLRQHIALRQNGGRISLSSMAVAVFEQYQQNDNRSTESGGVMIGRLILNSEDVVVDCAVPPAPNDRRTRLSYARGIEPSQQYINDAWMASGGARNYLGEWHTHPEDHPLPSHQDFLNWSHILLNTQLERDFLFFVIVGRKSIAIWEGTRSLSFVSLPPLEACK
jgi:integrative and conjugative element protein (TIGR02256 family)